MSLAIISTRVTVGIQSRPVSVEVDLANGLPAFNIVGLPEKAVQESKERVRGALRNSQFEFPARRITVNLAPADLPKVGSGFDLPIAIGILIASGQLPAKKAEQIEFIGELALSGELRPVKGALPIALSCKQKGVPLIFPVDNRKEIELINDYVSYPARHLLEVCAHLNDSQPLEPLQTVEVPDYNNQRFADLADIRGQALAKRALQIAAAGRHSLLMVGPPGSGKSMLASRLPGILPPLTDEQAIETAAIHSVSHQAFQTDNWKKPPFRSPHHSASSAALVGGGSLPQPGEISLAHHGVLFLDELTEFDRRTLDLLREPLENGYISISRVARKIEYPARFQLIAAMNPCPCGYLGDAKRACGTCTAEQIQRYQGKISGPVLDRIDLHIEVPAQPASLLTQPAQEISSDTMRQSVLRARQKQLQRAGKTNSELNAAELEQSAQPDRKGLQLLETAIDKMGLSARAYHRILRVARTIADLDDSAQTDSMHIAEAISYRKLERRLAI
jgi:magnesium chelatase family protein